MAIHIKLIQNKIKRSSSYGKYFAKAVSQGEVSLKELATEACENSGLSHGAVVHVVTELEDMLRRHLADGETVVLDGIGRFSLRVESIGVDDPKQFNIGRHITRILCHFLPSAHRRPDKTLSYDFAKDVKVEWEK